MNEEPKLEEPKPGRGKLNLLTPTLGPKDLFLHGLKLAAGPNTIPHTLGRTLTGWTLIRLNAPSLISDDQDSNTEPETYLVLVASAPCTISIMVF
jgi:hypothetical protein